MIFLRQIKLRKVIMIGEILFIILKKIIEKNKNKKI